MREFVREFVVEVNNEILGNSIRICNLRSLKGFNLVAYELAKRANEDGKKHTAGMWTVYPYKGKMKENDLLSAAKTGAKWMRWWLEENECDCEGSHICGRTERMRELEQMERVIARHEADNAHSVDLSA